VLFFEVQQRNPPIWRVLLFLLGVYDVLAKFLIILLQRQLLAWVFLSLVIVPCVIHVSRNTSLGVALRYEFY